MVVEGGGSLRRFIFLEFLMVGGGSFFIVILYFIFIRIVKRGGVRVGLKMAVYFLSVLLL